jgi:hypothetical protein
MSWDWYTTELDARRRHADDLRRAARARLADEAVRAARGRQGPGRLRRILDRFAGWPATGYFRGNRPPATATEASS